MGSDVGQIFATASLHRDQSISNALVCEKELSHMGKNNRNPDLVCENTLFLTKLDILCNALLSNFHPLNLHMFTSRVENTVDPDSYRLYLHVLSYLRPEFFY